MAEALKESFFTTKQSKKIHSIKLDKPIQGLRTFRSNTTLITKRDVSEQLSQDRNQTNIQFVKIQILPLNFMYQKRGWFGECVRSIKLQRIDTIFGSKIMRALFNEYFPGCRTAIIKRGLIPFLVYFTTTFIFNYFQVKSKENLMGYEMSTKVFWTCSPFMALGWVYYTFHEFLQFKDIWQRLKTPD